MTSTSQVPNIASLLVRLAVKNGFINLFDVASILFYLKVGSTTWLALFLELSDKKNTIMEKLGPKPKLKGPQPKIHSAVPELFRIRSLNNTNLKSLAELSTSFSMVRHPFER